MIILYQFSLPHLYIALYKVGRMYFWNLGVKGLIMMMWQNVVPINVQSHIVFCCYVIAASICIDVSLFQLDICAMCGGNSDFALADNAVVVDLSDMRAVTVDVKTKVQYVLINVVDSPYTMTDVFLWVFHCPGAGVGGGWTGIEEEREGYSHIWTIWSIAPCFTLSSLFSFL